MYANGPRSLDGARKVRPVHLGRRLALLLLSALCCVPVSADVVQYRYDELGRLRTVIHDDGRITTYALDSAGNRTRVITAVDSTPPTAPSGLSATAISASQINLVWTAATDTGSGVATHRIERCANAGCSNFAEVASVAGTTAIFSDTGLPQGTTYVYRIRAVDWANQVSTPSNTVTATTQTIPDLDAPSVPTGLSANAPASNQVNLTWNVSTDTGGSGLAGYYVERCTGSSCSNFSRIGSPTTNSYVDTTTSGSIAYRYRVQARDNASNVSGFTSPVLAQTPDTLPPNAPSGLGASASNPTTIALSWTAATDNGGSGVVSYRIERCQNADCTNFTFLRNVATTSTSDTPVSSSTTYRYRVAAIDNASLTGPFSNIASATTPSAPDLENPTAPSALTQTSATSTLIVFGWTGSTDGGGSGLASYRIERCTGSSCSNFGEIGTTIPPTVSYSDSTVSGTVQYRYRVRARDGAGNNSSYSNILNVQTPDTLAPSTPANLTATPISSTNVRLNWGASTDTGGSGLLNYRIERCVGSTTCENFALLTHVGSAAITYDDTSVSGTTTYRYRIRASDNQNNVSAWSAAAGATTTDTIAPNAPTNLNGSSPNSNTVNLTWTAATDTGGAGVASHRVERCTGLNCSNFTEIANLPGTSASSYSDTTVGGWTTYYYRVRAYDNAGLPGAYTAALRVDTGDTIRPNPPTLTATAIATTTIRLGFAGASDGGGSGIAGYRVERCTGAGCTNFAVAATLVNTNPWDDASVAGYTWYRYRVYTVDSASNISDPSNIVEVRSLDQIAPGTPAIQSVTPVTSNRIDIIWNAVTDSGGSGLAAYHLERCTGSGCSTGYSEIGSTTGTSFNDTAVVGMNSYTYRVRSREVANNFSGYSAMFVGTTSDTDPPSTPGNLGASAANSTTINLTWNASSDTGGSGLRDYVVERCTGSSCGNFSQIGTSTSTSYSDGTLAGSTTYRYRVWARDNVFNRSGDSNIASASTPTGAVINLPNSSFSGGGGVWEISTHYEVTATGDVRVNNVDIGDWIVPKTGMSNYELSASHNCFYPSGTFNTWMTAGVGTGWGVSLVDWQAQGLSEICQISIAIRAKSNPSVIIDTASFDINVFTGP